MNWKRQLNILWVGQALLMAAMAMSLPYWPLYIETLADLSPTEVRYWSAAIYLAPFLTAFLSAPLWGRLGDKYGYKSMVIRASLGLFLTQALIFISTDVVIIFLIRLLQGALAGFIVAAQAWGLAITPANQQSKTLGKLHAATAVGGLCGPLLGGLIATIWGYQTIFLAAVIISSIISFAFILFLQNPRTQPSLASQKTSSRSLKSVFFKPLLLTLLLAVLLAQIARNLFTPLFALFVTENLGGNDLFVGILYGGTGLMVLLCAPLWGKLFDYFFSINKSLYNLLGGILFAAAVIQVLHAFTFSLYGIFILRLLWGVCLAAILPLLLKMITGNVLAIQRGEYLGWGNSASKLGEMLGVVSGAILESYLGFSTSFLVTAMIYFVAAGVIWVNFSMELHTGVTEPRA
jgi:MFS family permease